MKVVLVILMLASVIGYTSSDIAGVWEWQPAEANNVLRVALSEAENTMSMGDAMGYSYNKTTKTKDGTWEGTYTFDNQIALVTYKGADGKGYFLEFTYDKVTDRLYCKSIEQWFVRAKKD